MSYWHIVCLSVLPFIHSFNRYLLIPCYILGIVLNTSDTIMNITKQKFSVLVWLVDLFFFKVWPYTSLNWISLLSSISFLYFSFHFISPSSFPILASTLCCFIYHRYMWMYSHLTDTCLLLCHPDPLIKCFNTQLRFKL